MSLNIPWLVSRWGPWLCLVVVAACLLRLYNPNRKHMPPRVKAWPILNHTLMHVKDDPTEMLKQWAKEYGEIFRTRSGVTDFIWLNSREAVKELFDRRSAIYSSRQPMPMALDAATCGNRVTFMPYGKRWRSVRNIMHRTLTLKNAEAYSVIQDFESKQLLVDLLNTPNDFYMHNRRYSASVIFQVVYGRRIPQWDCQDIKEIFEVLSRFVQVRRPGEWLVDVFPSLADSRLFDLFSPWRKVGKAFFKADNQVFQRLWQRMQADVACGSVSNCFGKDFIEARKADKYDDCIDDLQAAWLCGGLVEAGSETTSAALNNFIKLLLSNPEAQRRAHEELDAVVGDRLPTFADEPNLPYIRAICKEILRMRPVNKFGVNHSSTQDDWYKGYFIPKGSVVMINMWAIQYDPSIWKDPEKFEPARYLGWDLTAAESAVAEPTKRDHYTYGGGRRICAGIHVAEKSIFINVARILYGFDLGLAVDENGPIELDFTTASLNKGSGTVSKPFQCSITPRSEKHAALMRQEWADAEAKGLENEIRSMFWGVIRSKT